MALLKVCAVGELQPGAVTEAISGERPFAVVNFSGEIVCFDGTCPHAGGPLGQGNVQDNMVICPWHEWAYDCRTGENDFDPSIKLDLFQVKAEGDDILIDPQASA